jgi:hypothetical protein
VEARQSPASSVVGTVGAAAERIPLVIAKALMRPSRSCGRETVWESIIRSIRSPSMSCIACAPLR